MPIAHVEAGLRSGDLAMPEERNRIAVDRIAALLFCPDERSAGDARREGVPGRAEVVGDVMADATRAFAPLARERRDVTARLGVDPGGYGVVTIHREANVAPAAAGADRRGAERDRAPARVPGASAHARALDASGSRSARTSESSRRSRTSTWRRSSSQARVIVTDSGGLQKEAYWHRVPCVTPRPSTEWVDTVEAGANVLVDDDPDALAKAVADARFPADAPPLYGDGKASERRHSLATTAL